MVRRMRPRIQALVDRLLDRAEAAGGLDVIADLAYPLPATIAAELLGVPTADLELVKRWSDDLAGSFTYAPDSMHRAHAAIVQLTAYMKGLVTRRSDASADGLLATLARAHAEDGTLTEEELLAQGVMLLFAGHETTTGLIGNGALALLRHPAQLARLRAEPGLIETAIDELLRFDSPTQATFRSVAEDFELRGQRLHAGDPVLLMLGSANRDPAAFERPDALDIARRDNHHLAFSQGPHFCLGAALAWLEGQIALHTLFGRFRRVRLVDAEPTWVPNVFLRRPEALPVAL
jgi:pimeloyl-[acyl-carrier protein] synthase